MHGYVYHKKEKKASWQWLWKKLEQTWATLCTTLIMKYPLKKHSSSHLTLSSCPGTTLWSFLVQFEWNLIVPLLFKQTCASTANCVWLFEPAGSTKTNTTQPLGHNSLFFSHTCIHAHTSCESGIIDSFVHHSKWLWIQQKTELDSESLTRLYWK